MKVIFDPARHTMKKPGRKNVRAFPNLPVLDIGAMPAEMFGRRCRCGQLHI